MAWIKRMIQTLKEGGRLTKDEKEALAAELELVELAKKEREKFQKFWPERIREIMKMRDNAQEEFFRSRKRFYGAYIDYVTAAASIFPFMVEHQEIMATRIRVAEADATEKQARLNQIEKDRNEAPVSLEFRRSLESGRAIYTAGINEGFEKGTLHNRMEVLRFTPVEHHLETVRCLFRQLAAELDRRKAASASFREKASAPRGTALKSPKPGPPPSGSKSDQGPSE